MSTLPAPVIRFDPATHTYTADGRTVPSVTQALKAAGYYRFLDGAPDHVMVEARERGERIHLACELLANGLLDWSSVDDSDLPYVQAFERWMLDTGFEPVHTEHVVYHPVFRYAGRLDMAGSFPNRSKALIDLKTCTTLGRSARKAAYRQLAAYDVRVPGFVYPRRIALQLKSDGSYSAWEAPSDTYQRHFHAFLAALSVANDLASEE